MDNPFSNIRKLEDVIPYSPWTKASIDIMRAEMVGDPSHDEGHILRVVKHALWFSDGGDPDVIIPAAILHDLVNVPKNSPLRGTTSTLSAEKAIASLLEAGCKLQGDQKPKIYNAICAHSYSANIRCASIEAEAVQDADRIDSLGLIGLARLFAVTGALGRKLWHTSDPFHTNRALDESEYGVDHYYIKLNKLADTMKTRRGRELAIQRTQVMNEFLRNLNSEIVGDT